MNEFLESAVKKLQDGKIAKLTNAKANVMKEAVADRLIYFCRQEPEFAQAVVQGGSFADCMNAVASEVKGNSISDEAAYGAAVRFYFPGAEIRVTMTIDLIGAAAEPEAPKGIVVDLSDFF